MGAIGLAEAARLTGKNQSTIHRAMKLGRLSTPRTTPASGGSTFANQCVHTRLGAEGLA